MRKSILLLSLLMLSFCGLSAQNMELVFRIDQPYLLLPTAHSGNLQHATVQLDGEWYDELDIRMTGEIVDYYSFINLSAYQGRELTITFSHPDDAIRKILKEHVFLSDEISGQDEVYHESLRPRYHFSAPRNWLNDPNGLFYLNGEYHMYYQHNPYGWQWGNMHWGHATSKDLIHWKNEPVAIYPVKDKDVIAVPWTGSAVVDIFNTSGLQKGELPPVLAIYARKGTGTVIEYSNDGGYTFEEYEDNPVLGGVGDPNVVWYAPGHHWVMVHRHWVNGQEGIAFYTSPDLKKWTYQSYLGPFHTCPVFFPIKVDGTNEEKWLLHDGHSEYIVGDFDGKIFTPNTEKIEFSKGYAFMASQTFANMPENMNRRIRMAWAWNSFAPGMPFNQFLLVPTELKVREIDGEYRLCPTPVAELASLQGNKVSGRHASTEKFNERVQDYPAGEYRLKMELGRIKEAATLHFNGLELKFDPEANKIYCKGNLHSNVGLIDDQPAYRWKNINENGVVEADFNMNKEIKLDILVDRLVVEIFVNDGEVYMPLTQYIYPKGAIGELAAGENGQKVMSFFTPSTGMTLQSEDPKMKVKHFELYSMDAIW